MRRLLPLLMTFVLVFLLLPNGALAQRQATVRLFVEASIGVDVSAPDEVTLNLGEQDGFFIEVINEANVRDRIRLEGTLVPETEWIDFAFECVGGRGECDSVLNSETHTIDNMELTPSINSTTIHVQVVGWRKTKTMSQQPRLALTGFSLTNATKQSLHATEIMVEDPDAGFGPLSASGLNNYAAAGLAALAGLIAYREI